MTTPADKNFLCRLTSCFWEPFYQTHEFQPSLYEQLCEFESEYDKTTSQPEFLKTDIERLALKLNNIAENIAITPLKHDELCKIYELTDRLMILCPINSVLWKSMARPVQELTQRLHPFFEPPTSRADLAMRNPKASRLHRDITQVIVFGDQHSFRAAFNETKHSKLLFSIKNQNEVRLEVTTSLDLRIQEAVQKFVTHIPFGIENFYRTEKIFQLISHFNSRKNVASQLAPQLYHQLFVVKQSYLNMVMQAAGIPSPSPLEYSAQGDWMIEKNETIESLNDFLDRTGNREEIAIQIVQFLVLEKTFGIYAMGDSETELNPKYTNIFEIRGKTLFCSLPRKKIEFLIIPFTQRLDEVCRYIEKAYPELAAHIPRVKEEVLMAPNPSEAIKLLHDGFLSGLLKNNHPLNKAIATILLQLPESFFSARVSLESFQTLEDFYLYCRFHLELANGEFEAKSSFESLFLNCKELILGIPDKDKAHPLQNGTDFSKVIDWDILMRSKIRFQAIKEIVQLYELNPEKPLQLHAEDLITALVKKLNEDPILKEENPMQHPTIGEFFLGIFWAGFIEELNSWSDYTAIPISLQSEIILIASGIQSPENKQEDLEKILYENFVIYKNNRISAIAKSALNDLFG